MGIKYLRGVAPNTSISTLNFRPDGFDYPKGLKFSSPFDGKTLDFLIVGGGGNGGGNGQSGTGGGGGGGGFRAITGNATTFLSNPVLNPAADAGKTVVPVTVAGGGGGGSTFAPTAFGFCSAGGGVGGRFFSGYDGPGYRNGGGGGSGGGAGGGPPESTTSNAGGGTAGQGCPGGGGGRSHGCGGGAAAPGDSGGAATPSSFTGTPISYSCGGPSPSTKTATANRGDGGGRTCTGGSGVVAVRYCNPAAPTTPLATGGNTICCTGGCIIHVFNTSAFFNIAGAGFCID